MLPQHIQSEKGFGSAETIQEKVDTHVWNLNQALTNNSDLVNFIQNHSNQRYSQEIQSLKGSWTYQEQIQLYRLHDELGNKWSMIAEYFQNRYLNVILRNDNSVKNHFYSRLRKALRRLNKIICVQMKKSMKEIKNNVIYKIIEVTQERHKVSGQNINSVEVTQLCRELKSRLLNFSYDQTEIDQSQKDFYSVGKQLIEDLVSFNRQYRRKAKKTNNQVKEAKLILKNRNKNKNSQKQLCQMNTMSISQCSLFESQSSESQSNKANSHKVLTRRRAKSGEFLNIKRSDTGMSAPIIQQKQNLANEHAETFFKQSSILESNLIYIPEMLKQQSSDIHNGIGKMIQDFHEYKFFDQQNEDQSMKMVNSQDHFSDPFLSEGNFNWFK